MNPVVIGLIISLAEAFIGSETFARIEASVLRWEDSSRASADSALSGTDKKAAVLAELELIGLDLAGWAANLLIELAVSKFNINQGKIA